MVLKYNDKVIDHFRNPRNVGSMEDASVSATEGSVACGDMMTIYLKVENEIIVDVKFESYGCAANIATASVVTELAKDKTLDEAKAITWNDVVEALEGLPKIKYHCSSLAVETLHAAVDKYKEMVKKGEIEEKGGEMRHTEKGGLLKAIENRMEGEEKEDEERERD